MRNRTPFFKGFNRVLFGRPRRSAKEKLIAEAEALHQSMPCQLMALFAPFLSLECLKSSSSGVNSRRRDYDMVTTFCAFLSQVLSRGCSCREIVRKIQVWRASRRERVPDSDTSAYCKARKRLPLETLHDIHRDTAAEVDRVAHSDQRWCGRVVKVVDGTGLSMPDTSGNQKAFPQPNTQKKGCGFPVVKLVACFSLASGALLDWVEGTLKNHEADQWRKLWHLFNPGDVVLGDRGFCSYAAIGALLNKGVDSVMRVSGARKIDWRQGTKLSKNDRLKTWRKPQARLKTWKKREWNRLPDTIKLRLVRINVTVRGFRPETIFLVTTLTDPTQYTVEQLQDLYLKRWGVELFFRDIKITLGMDVLRCLTPDMVRREIVMHAIAYNLIRANMQRAAQDYQIELSQISFKGTVDTIRQWTELLNAARGKPRAQKRIIDTILEIVADDKLLNRPNRTEPRVKKRRPKNYNLMTQPRHKMVVSPSRHRPQVRS